MTQRKASASGSLGEDVGGTRTDSKQKRIASKLVEILQLSSMIEKEIRKRQEEIRGRDQERLS